uniref:Uncharacterized protein n=1 Tax=Arundo donax TaxID=35708 RepID=A0A0A8YVD7_ARUDO
MHKRCLTCSLYYCKYIYSFWLCSHQQR